MPFMLTVLLALSLLLSRRLLLLGLLLLLDDLSLDDVVVVWDGDTVDEEPVCSAGDT